MGCVPPHLSTPAVEREITPWKPCSTTGGRRHLSYTRECSYAIIMIFMLSFRVVYFQHKLVSHRMRLSSSELRMCVTNLSLCTYAILGSVKQRELALVRVCFLIFLTLASG